ncbi:MAG TPA: mechanosensitive ion channel family protein [Nannocystaceae bacterium]|nr:mechanosensitive ion channel family protein [Nannocystaceae bacterium]
MRITTAAFEPPSGLDPRRTVDALGDLWADPLLRQSVGAVIAIGLIFLIVSLLRAAARRTIKDVDARYRTQKAILFLGYLITIVYLMAEVSGRLSGLGIALGAASAGVAFALQEVIASIAGWLALSVGSFYKVGDRVQLGGIRGDVIDIGVLRTTLMECGGWVNGDLYNGRIVRLANSFVFKEPVFNYSADFAFLWDELTLPVKYGSDYALARRILGEVAEGVVGEYTRSAEATWKHMVRTYRIEDARVTPMVTMAANDNWVEFTLRYVVDFKLRRSVKDQLFTRILAAVEASGGAVALASATLEVRLGDATLRSSAP